ncbi:MAG: acetyl-CoA carboxylase carboxyltransferase subunit alpha [Candidatus Aureabacteria bacterium]|nr:acetyl-CoA carboxylase carboxyltransferase subunit alpha [Candidatus Auribacterota bacterium]
MEPLDFEKPLMEIEKNIVQLKEKALNEKIDFSETIAVLEKEVIEKKKQLYRNLSPDQRLKIARHPNRPNTLDYISFIFKDFIELHGDRVFGDDNAIIAGLATVGGHGVVVIGQQKGKDTKEKLFRNFGMAHPEGYRKALRIMQMASRFQVPIISFIDTPGAFPGISAEERGQASAIAVNLREMMSLKTPVICYVIGEGGSGGALGIAVGDKIVMLEHAYYSVISPEGCAAILWKTATKTPEAAQALKMTATDLHAFGIVDEILEEPLGGAHRNPQEMAQTIKLSIIQTIEEFSRLGGEALIRHRQEKFRQIGVYQTQALSQPSVSQTEMEIGPSPAFNKPVE